MAKKNIRLAKGLEIPLNVTTQKIALMGGNGSGKSYLGSKIIEEILRAEGWVIIFDPVGIHYGLRLASDGITPSGLDIPVFGGLHGDIILTPESGAIIADLLVDRRLSAVLDVSQFSDSELNRFSTDFGNQFWLRMKSKRQAVLLVFEECQEFIPQNPMKGEERKLHIYTRIAKLGRNYGIGVMLISQRPQDINKKVFNLTQLMFAFQMTGTHERKSMEEWISYVGLEEKFSNILPKLEVGEPFVASPRWLKIAETFHIEKKFTYDSSSTPDFEEDIETIHLEPIDITALENRMKSLIQEAKENNPVELKKELARLKKELEKKPAPIQETKIERIEIPVITDKQITELGRSLESIQGIYKNFRDLQAEIVSLLNGKFDALNNAAVALSSAVASAKKPEPIAQSRPAGNTAMRPRPELPAKKPIVENEEISISRPMQRILNSIAWMESIGLYNPSRVSIAFLSDQSSKSSTYGNNLSVLRTNGLIVYPDSKTVALTEAGRGFAEVQDRPLTIEDLQASILGKIPTPQARILEILISAYPESVDRETLADQAGQSPKSSTYGNHLSSLRTFGLIDYPNAREAVALPVLFLE